MKLVEPFLNIGYVVYIDNFYTSPLLLNDLLDVRTFASGTISTNRKFFPKMLKIETSEKPKRGVQCQAPLGS